MNLNLTFFNTRQTFKAMQKHGLFFQFLLSRCIGKSSSPLPTKRPVGRTKKEFSCEQLNFMLEQNHDFNALLTSYEKRNKTIANFYFNINKASSNGNQDIS